MSTEPADIQQAMERARAAERRLRDEDTFGLLDQADRIMRALETGRHRTREQDQRADTSAD